MMIGIPNINFFPRVTKNNSCPRLRFTLLLDKSTFVAGEILYGRVEVQCSSSNSVQLGGISVELSGYEELYNKGDVLLESFLFSNIILQGVNKPQTRAIRGQRSSDGFWCANKGRFTFSFAFKLPVDVPSCFDFKNVLGVKYKVTALAPGKLWLTQDRFLEYKYHEKIEALSKTANAFVVEQVDLSLAKETITKSISGQPWLSRGSVHLECSVRSPLVCAGQDVRLDISVLNDTHTRLKGLKIYSLRVLNHLLPNYKEPLEDYSTTFIKSSNFIVEPGEHRLFTQTIRMPASLLTVQKAILGQLVSGILVCLGMGSFQKDLKLFVPVTVAHPASLMPIPDFQPVDLMYHSHHVHHLDWEEPVPERSLSLTRPCRSLSPVRTQEHQGSPPGRYLPWSDDEEDEICSNSSERGRSSPDTSFSDTSIVHVSPRRTNGHRPAKPLPIPKYFRPVHREFKSI